MTQLWQTLILNPIFNILIVIYSYVGNLGLAIIVFTVLIKFVLIPLTIPSLKMSKKQRDMQPELEKIKEKFSYDKKKLAEKQMELMKKHGVNPGAGCLTTIITIILMFGVYRAVSTLTLSKDISEINNHVYFESFKIESLETINTRFLYLDLTKPDPYLIITIFSVLLQFLSAKMLMPFAKVSEKAVKKTPGKTDDLMQSMQQQNLYMMPLMFFIFGLTLPSGVMIYITISTLFQLVQTYFFSGWGGLEPWIKKLGFKTKGN